MAVHALKSRQLLKSWRVEGSAIPPTAASLREPTVAIRRAGQEGRSTMRIAGLAAFMGMSVLPLFVQPAPAWAEADCKALVAPPPFGPDDQTGATNRITPAVTKAAAAEIQTGAVTAMAYPLTDGIPLFGTRFSKTILTSFATMPGAEFGKNK